MLSASFSRGVEKFDLEFDDVHFPLQLSMECSILFKIRGQCGGDSRIDESHVPFVVDGYLVLDLDLVHFQVFARIRIFSGLGEVWYQVMICNMV